ESKVDAIIKIAPPKTRRQLKRFLGMINYYRDMLPQRAKTLAGLNKLTSPNVPFKWTHQHHDEFEQAKRLIAERTLLAYPDFTKPFHVYTDASKLAMGGYIEQDGKPIAFWSKTTSPAQANYAANKLELLSIVCLLTEFRGILLGHQLIIHTDHKNLLYSKMGNAQMLRWRLLIKEFGPSISYVPGKSNVMADSLSWLENMDQRRPESICALTFDFTSIFPLDLATIADHQANDPDIVDDMQLRRQEISGHIVFTTPDGKIRLPKSLQRAVFDTYHSWLLHPGSNSALNSLKEIFHWPSMSKNVSDWSKSCSLCLNKKKTLKYGHLPAKEVVTHPWYEIAIDSIGPYGEKKFRALTIIDTTTRLCEIAPAREMDSATAAHLTHTHTVWFSRYPRPMRCIHDQGSEFKLEFAELLESYGVKSVPTTSKNPQANGIIERIHLVIGDKMRTQEIKDFDQWETFCAALVYALRSTTSSMLNTSPGAAVFGRNMLFDLSHVTNWIEVHKKKVR
ncbi:hypothetical protein AeRB84_007417, partial [Aphanomyces euteiches]